MKKQSPFNGSPFFDAKPFSKLSFGKQQYESSYSNQNSKNSKNRQKQYNESQQSSQADYTQIINQFLSDSDEWSEIPQIVQLTLKAIRDGLTTVQEKCVQNRMIINQQGIKIKQNEMHLTSKVSKKDLTNQMRQFMRRQNLINHSNSKQHSYQTTGLDRTMIQEVKTIADALISKKMEQFQQHLHNQKVQLNKQLNKINEKIQQLSQKQLQISSFKKKDKSFQNDSSSLTSKNVDQLFKQQKIINQKLEIFSKQLYNEKQTISGLYKYIQQKYSPKQEIQLLLQQIKNEFENQLTKIKTSLQKYKSKQTTNNQNNIDFQDYQNNMKIQVIIQELLKKNKSQQKKQFNEFKQKISKQLSNMATLSEVQAIINNFQKQMMSNYKKINQKVKKLQKETNYNNKTLAQSKKTLSQQETIQKTLTKRVMSKKNLSKSKISKTSKSPISNNCQKRSVSPSPISHKCSISTSKSPQKISKYKTTQYRQEKRAKKEKKVKQSLESLKKIEQLFIFKQKQLQIQIQQKFNKKLIKSQQKIRGQLQDNFKHFCKTIEQSQDKLTQNMKVFNKEQKSDIQRAVFTLSSQLILARFICQGQCNKNQLIKWQQSTNTMTENFILNAQTNKFKKTIIGERNKITIKETGIYQIKSGFYSTIQKGVNYQILLNEEKVYQDQQTFIHPSRGILFNQVLLIPAGSKISIRILQRLQNFQAFVEMKKM